MDHRLQGHFVDLSNMLDLCRFEILTVQLLDAGKAGYFFGKLMKIGIRRKVEISSSNPRFSGGENVRFREGKPF